MKYGDFWPDFTELIFTLNLLPPDIKYAYSILFSMHFLWYWRRIKYAQKSAIRPLDRMDWSFWGP